MNRPARRLVNGLTITSLILLSAILTFGAVPGNHELEWKCGKSQYSLIVAGEDIAGRNIALWSSRSVLLGWLPQISRIPLTTAILLLSIFPIVSLRKRFERSIGGYVLDCAQIALGAAGFVAYFAFCRTRDLWNTDDDGERIFTIVVGVAVPAAFVLFAAVSRMAFVFQSMVDWILPAPIQGICHTCGYDLRASKERCPECGRAISVEEQVVIDRIGQAKAD